jgi:hypothetical protein
MYTEVCRIYCNYIKVYVTVANKTDILSKGMKNISDDVRQLSTSQILKNAGYFDELMA